MAEEKSETIITDNEDAVEEDKTSDEKNEEESEDKETDSGKEKFQRSEIAQKIKYREKLRDAQSKISELQAKLTDKSGEKPSDDAEARAKAYIRSEAKAVYEELQTLRKSEEERITREFEDKIEEVMDENPNVSEKELLDICEEYEVEPKVAIKILNKTASKKEKPKMPQAKRASIESEPEKSKPDDSKKSWSQILREETVKLKNK